MVSEQQAVGNWTCCVLRGRAAYPSRVTLSAVRIGVLAVQGDVREHIHALSALGAQVIGVRRPRELDDVDALVIPGGESTTMDKLVRAFDLQEPLRKRISDGMPVYGSCAGMIMLADRIADARPDQDTLGGLDITVRRNAFGRQVDSFEADLHIPRIAGATTAPEGHPQTFKAVFIRAPGSTRWASALRCWRRSSPDRQRAGSSRSSRATCSPRPFTPRSPGITASTITSSRWFAQPSADQQGADQ